MMEREIIERNVVVNGDTFTIHKEAERLLGLTLMTKREINEYLMEKVHLYRCRNKNVEKFYEEKLHMIDKAADNKFFIVSNYSGTIYGEIFSQEKFLQKIKELHEFKNQEHEFITLVDGDGNVFAEILIQPHMDLGYEVARLGLINENTSKLYTEVELSDENLLYILLDNFLIKKTVKKGF